MKGVTQAEFARAQGWAKSYITKLKAEGRLVLADDGSVLSAESLERIRSSTNAPARASSPAVTANFTTSQARERHYAAELKRLEFERETGAVRPAADLHSSLRDAGTAIRVAVEAFRDRLPGKLAPLAGDENRIAALMASECEALLRSMVDRFSAMAAHEAPEGATVAP